MSDKARRQPIVPTVYAPQTESEAPYIPPPQISVREWALARAAEVGHETALAFISEYRRGTGTAAELEAALAAFRSRVIHP